MVLMLELNDEDVAALRRIHGEFWGVDAGQTEETWLMFEARRLLRRAMARLLRSLPAPEAVRTEDD